MKANPFKKYSFSRLLVIALLSVFFGFLGLTSYYIWIEQFGSIDDKQQLAQDFQAQQLSVRPELIHQASAQDINSDTLIHPHNPTIGNPQGTVRIIAFIDFDCPFCQASYPLFESIIETYGTAVHIIFKHFPIESIHPNAVTKAMAAQCAAQQESFWPYYRLLFEETSVSTEVLATRLQLNLNMFNTCMQDPATRRLVEQDIADAMRVGVRGTPSYIIDDQLFEGSLNLATWQKEIIAALQQD